MTDVDGPIISLFSSRSAARNYYVRLLPWPRLFAVHCRVDAIIAAGAIDVPRPGGSVQLAASHTSASRVDDGKVAAGARLPLRASIARRGLLMYRSL